MTEHGEPPAREKARRNKDLIVGRDSKIAPDDPVIDAAGFRCPMPVILLERALRRMAAGERLKIVADDPIAAIDIPHFARAAGASAECLAPAPDAPPGTCVFLVTAGEKRD